MPRKSANCYIVAGPNGAGKTTFATEFLPRYANCRNFVNPDLLARAFSPFDPDAGETTIEDAAFYEQLRGQFTQ
jgi:predicted ABC-type ATPase